MRRWLEDGVLLGSRAISRSARDPAGPAGRSDMASELGVWMASNRRSRYTGHMNEASAPVVSTAVLDRDDRSTHAIYGLAAEVRAVESGHNARVLPDGSVLVKSDSQPGSHRVWIRGISDGTLLLGCTCRSGTHRTWLPVPCKHAALAGRRLEREGLARWHDGAWQIGQRAQVRGLRLLLAHTIDHGSATGPTTPATAGEAEPTLQAA
jgi:hypothetical protein